MVSMSNIKTTRPMKKLDIRYSGPYEVLELIGTHACRIKLPETAKIHNVFHVSLIKPFVPPMYPGQSNSPPGPVVTEYGQEEYEVASVLDSRINKRTRKLEYLVEWLGYEGTDEHASWEPRDNLEGSREAIVEFHLANPDKPSASLTRTRRK